MPVAFSMVVRLLATVLCFGTAGGAASAMDFTTPLEADGRRVVIARGQIASGDAERFRVSLQSADQDSFGQKTVVLDSIGGAVEEAFAMAAFMDRDKVATVVRPGASCVSACAQIVFLAGVHRVVLEGGRLGLHSCSSGKGGARSLSCNEMMAKYATAHGVAYAPFMAFMQMTSPTQVRWLDSKDADCWGLTRWPPGIDRGTKAGELPPCFLGGPALSDSRVTSAGSGR